MRAPKRRWPSQNPGQHPGTARHCGGRAGWVPGGGEPSPPSSNSSHGSEPSSNRGFQLSVSGRTSQPSPKHLAYVRSVLTTRAHAGLLSQLTEDPTGKGLSRVHTARGPPEPLCAPGPLPSYFLKTKNPRVSSSQC